MSDHARGRRGSIAVTLLAASATLACLPDLAVGERLPAACEKILETFAAQQQAASEDTTSNPTGTVAVSLLNEIAIGEQNGQAIESRHGILASEQVQRVMAAVARFADRPVLTYRAQVLGRTEQMNAFSLAGGRIYVTNALLEAMEPTDGELAFIIGHELAHAALRHIPSHIESAWGDYMARVRICAAAHDGKIDEKAVIPAFQTLELASSFMHAEREFEADQFGALYAVQAGYPMADSFSALKKIRKLMGDESVFGTAAGSMGDHYEGSIYSLPTHPPITARLEQLNRFSAQLQTVADAADAAVQKLEARQYAAAAEAFATAAKFFPQSRALRMNLALANHLQFRASAPPGDLPPGLLSTPEKLEADFRRLVTRGGPASPDTTAINRAVAGYRQILAQDGEHYLARNNLGVAYLDLEQTDRAIAEFEKALSVPTDYVVAHRNLTLACLGKLRGMGEGAAAAPDGAALIRKADRAWTAFKDLRGSLLSPQDLEIGRLVEGWRGRL